MPNTYFPNLLINLIVTGPYESGKSEICRKLSNITILGKHEQQSIKYYNFEYNKYKYRLTDIPGKDKFNSIESSYFKGAGFVLMVIDPFSEDCKYIIPYLKNILKQTETEKPKFGHLILYSKSDKETVVNSVRVNLNKTNFENEYQNIFGRKPETITVSVQNSNLREMVLTKIKNIIELPQKMEAERREALAAAQSIQQALQAYPKKRSFFAFARNQTRNSTKVALIQDLNDSINLQQIKNALIKAACDIYTPLPNGKRKFGLNIFHGTIANYPIHWNMPFRTIEDSELYQIIKSELFKIDPAVILKNELKIREPDIINSLERRYSS